MTIPWSGSSLPERLHELISYAILGACPADGCPDCGNRAGAWCEQCVVREADLKTLDATLREVDEAASAADALGAFLVMFAGLAGADRRTRAAVRQAAQGAPITPAQREFVVAMMTDSIRYLLSADDEDDRIQAARREARERVRGARTTWELGLAMTGSPAQPRRGEAPPLRRGA